jgi:hypothetical protein
MQRKLNRLWQTLVLLVATATVIGTIIWLLVDALLGGAM